MLSERFTSKYTITPHDCWLWTAGLTTKGFGKYSDKGKTHVAHKYLYESLYGTVSPNLRLVHSCGNRSCVNPDHLVVKTAKEIANTRKRRTREELVPGVLPERFKNKFEIGKDGCWLWTAYTNHSGYGVFGWEGTTYMAHRFAYKVLESELDSGLHLHHTCHERTCVNPDHLRPMTPTAHGRGHRWSGNFYKTECLRGHSLLDESNVARSTPNGSIFRKCKACAKYRYEWDKAIEIDKRRDLEVSQKF